MDTPLAQMIVMFALLTATLYRDIINEKYKWLFVVVVFTLSSVLALVTFRITTKADNEKELANKKYDSLRNIEFNYIGAGKNEPIYAFARYSPTVFQEFILNNDSFPIRDIRITIKDEDKFTVIKQGFKKTSQDSAIDKRDRLYYTQRHFNDWGNEIFIPVLTGNDNMILPDFDVTNKSHLKLTIDISWSNGWITYYIEYQKANNGWKGTWKRYNRRTNETQTHDID